MTVLSRDAVEVEALLTDRYLESLIAARDRGAIDAPSPLELDPAVRGAAAQLATAVSRIHPSFRFEERLAARLDEVGSRLAASARLPELADLPEVDLLDPARAAAPSPGLPRTVIIGGTLASAALSLAGAAVLAWRLSHGDPMSRAARAAHARSQGVRLA